MRIPRKNSRAEPLKRPLTRLSGTLSPSEGERDGVRGDRFLGGVPEGRVRGGRFAGRIIDVRLLALAALAVLVLAGCKRGPGEGAPTAPEKASAETSTEPRVSRDTNGNVMITLSPKDQEAIGLAVKPPEPAQLKPEVKGYGRVLDPAPLVAVLNDLASASAAASASSNELARLKTLTGQGNASERALEAAEATAARDQLAVQSARARLALAWGKTLGEPSELPTLVQSLTALQTLLVRIDLAAGDSVSSPPVSARIVPLSGSPLDGTFLGMATDVDPQTQGRGFIFRLSPNPGLAPGATVTGYLDAPGPPLTGVIIPRDAVVRAEGAGWVYVRGPATDTFVRLQILLERATPAGWFVQNSVSTNDSLVVTGAQQLLSLEVKGQSAE